MKKIIIYTAVITALLFAASCQKGVQGPAGPEGSGIAFRVFQNGAYPDASYAGCEDTRIWEYPTFVNSNYGNDTSSYIGIETDYIKNYLIRFDLSSIPPTAKITGAVLKMRLIDFMQQNSYAFRAVAEDWEETEATWNDRKTGVSWLDPGGDYYEDMASNSVTATVEGEYSWNIKASVIQEMVTGPLYNYGLILLCDTSMTNGNSSFATSENATVSYRPKLTVYYTFE